MLKPSRYIQSNEKFFQKSQPERFSTAEVLIFNEKLALELGVHDWEYLDEILSGQYQNMQPIALAYAGHQFGHFVPQLGDGRAHLLGEIDAPNGKNYDLQLKGSGRTPFSRGGDGFSPLAPALRELLISEAMSHLSIPTTRSLGVVKTGETVFRETEEPGAIVSRVATAHFRVGSFEYFAAREDKNALKELYDLMKNRLFPSAKSINEVYDLILLRQAELIANWMSIGFIHGVMNTDNMSLAGETIDFGPCAFMDEYHSEKVYSSIDRYGRYAYINQPKIAQWNLSVLAGCFALISNEKELEGLQESLNSWDDQYQQALRAVYAPKFGLEDHDSLSYDFIQNWLWLLEKYELDFTLSHRRLADYLDIDQSGFFPPEEDFENWFKKWKELIQEESRPKEIVKLEMNTHNPLIIPRNHQVDKALKLAVQGDCSYFMKLWEALKTPYQSDPDVEEFITPPQTSEKIKATFCGT